MHYFRYKKMLLLFLYNSRSMNFNLFYPITLYFQ
nr:MAG TPA: hypothetical protein [Caudoviricetes sp.]